MNSTFNFTGKPDIARIAKRHRLTGRGGGGGRDGGSQPPAVLKNFGQNAQDSGKSTGNKLFIESGFYDTTKRSILKSLKITVSGEVRNVNALIFLVI